MYKCEKCGKTYKKENFYLKHIEVCDVKEDISPETTEIVKPIEYIKNFIEPQEEEKTYTENEQYLIDTFSRFNPSNIEVVEPTRSNLMRIYREDYNRKISCDCASEYVRMYCFLNIKAQEIKNK